MCCAAASQSRGIVRVLSLIYDLRRMCWGYRARVTSSGVRPGEAVPEKTPASLVTATNTVLTSITSSFSSFSYVSPFPSYFTLFILFRLIISPSSPFPSYFPSPTTLLFWFFFFFFPFRLWSAARGIPQTQQVSSQQSTPSSYHIRWVCERVMHHLDKCVIGPWSNHKSDI